MNSPETLRVALVTSKAFDVATLTRLIQSDKGLEIVSIVLGAVAEAKEILASHSLDILVIDWSLGSPDEQEALRQITTAQPLLSVVLVAKSDAADTLMAALRSGVREVISSSTGSGEFSDMLFRIRARRSAPRSLSGKLLAFISCKGGSGATFIASNFAFNLAAHGSKRVLLIDLNLQFGDVILYLSDRRPTSSIVDVTRDIDRLDAALLKSATVEVLPNLSVLAAPTDPAVSGDMNPGAVKSLLEFACKQFDYIIVDLGGQLDAPTIEALDRADLIFPVVQQTLPYIRDGKRMLDVFKLLGYPTEKVRPILSRFDRTADVTAADLEDVLGIKIYASIANDYKVASASVNQGIPVSKLAGNSALSRSLSAFASLIEAPLSNAKPADKWLNRILKRA
jgi:pilus assembly protein CpaE